MVDAERVLEPVLGLLARPQDEARVLDEHVESVDVLEQPGCERADGPEAGQVEGQHLDGVAAAALDDLVDGGAPASVVAGGDDHPGAHPGELDRRFLADPGVPAGDDDRLALHAFPLHAYARHSRGVHRTHRHERGSRGRGAAVPADRGLRDHRRPAHGRARRQRRVDRLPVVPALRLAHDLRQAPRQGAAAARSASTRASRAGPPSRCTSPTRTFSSRASLERDGVAEVSDFMPVGIEEGRHPHAIVRRAKCVRGEVEFDVIVDPRFDYGRVGHKVELRDGGEVLLLGEDGTDVRAAQRRPPLRAKRRARRPVPPPRGRDRGLRAGGRRPGHARAPSAAPDFVAESFKETVNFWRTWIGRSKYQGRWREIVNRSALALKLLVSNEYGSLVAAATFGLPEEIGGERNWDYRYTWIRDASFTLYALIRLGYTTEAGRFMEWIEDRCMELNPDGSMQIMYGHDGRKILAEETLDHLEGYRGLLAGAHRERRVRAAAARHLRRAHGLGVPLQQVRRAHLARPVAEPRTARRLGDRALAAARRGHLGGAGRAPGIPLLAAHVLGRRRPRHPPRRPPVVPVPLRPVAQRPATRSTTTSTTNFWDRGPRRRSCSTTARPRSTQSTLLMPMVKFISPTDPRWLSTLRAIEEDLVDDSLVYRYRIGDAASDGLPGEEGTFNMCSFWYAEVLARSGDVQQARLVFEKMLGYANHLGLYVGGAGPARRAPGQLPAGVHAPRPDQRGVRDRSQALRRRVDGLAATVARYSSACQSRVSSASRTDARNADA